MKKLLRGLLTSALVCVMAVLLGGCDLFKPIEDLYTLPALPDEYSQLQASIQNVMNEMELEYASINYGSYTSTIQLLDMDNDGIQETAAVFLRVGSTANTSGSEKPLRVCLFRQNPDNTYRLLYTVQGDGTAIHSVAYEDLTGDGVREMIVSWQVSSKVYNLSAYQLMSGAAIELMSTSYNERYLAVDMDGDSCKELVVFQQHTSEEDRNRAEYYRYQDGTMMMASSAPLSADILSVTSARTGRLTDGVTGIYVNCDRENEVITDILVLTEGGLRNVTLNSELGYSSTTTRIYTGVSATDINRDGILEIPLPVPAVSIDPNAVSSHYLTYWRQFDSEGIGTVVSATYHATSDGWYLTLPTAWLGEVTVGRDDSRSSWGERAVVFYYWPNETTTTPAPFLTVYTLTGENRYSRSRMSGRVTLYTDTSSIYCANLNDDVWDCGIEAADLAGLFSLITTEWSTQ